MLVSLLNFLLDHNSFDGSITMSSDISYLFEQPRD